MATPAAVLSLLVKAEGATAAASQLTALDAVAKRTSAQMDTAGAAARRAGTSMSSAGASAGKAAGGMNAAGAAAGKSAAKQAELEAANKKGRAAMDSVGRKAGLVALGVGAIGAAAVNTAGNYEKSMNVLQSVSSATGSEMSRLSKLAIQLGADTKLPGTSAQDAAEAMTEMVKAGVSLKDTMSGVRGVLVLSAAAGVDNARAAEIASNALNVFKLRGRDVNMVVDQLANTANSSSVEINDVADSFKMAGAVFNAFQSPTLGAKNAMTELNVAIGLLGNAGIKGSDAGTSLKQMLLQLTGPSEKAKSAMRALYLAAQDSAAAEGHLDDVLHGSGKTRHEALKAIEKANPALKKQGDIAYDAAGRMRSLNDIVGLVAQGTKGMTQEQRNAYVTQIFGADATRAVTILMRAQGQEWGRMQKAVNRTGAAQDLANSKMKGFKGSLEALKSTMETLAINVGTKLLPAMTSLARTVTGLVGALSPTAWVILIGTLGTLALTVWTVHAAMKAYAALQVLITAATYAWRAAQIALNVAFLTNPLVLVVAAIAALVAAFVIAYKKSDTFRGIIDALWGVLRTVFGWVRSNWPLLLAILAGPFGLAALMILKHADAIKGVISGVFNWIKGHWPLLLVILAGPFALAVLQIVKHAHDIRNAVVGVFNAMVGAIKALASTFIGLGVWVLARIIQGIKSYVAALLAVGKWYYGRLFDGLRAVAGAIQSLGAWTVHRVVDGIRATTSGLLAIGSWLKNRLLDGLRTVKDGFMSLGGTIIDWIVDGLKAGANKLVGFLNNIVNVINKLPGVDIGKIKGFAEGGVNQGNVPRGLAHGGAFARTKGVVNGPITLMGEEAPRHPEYVIPTNPAYRKRAQGLLGQAAGALGLAQGGLWSVGELEDLWKSQGGPASVAHTMALVATAESGAVGRFANQYAHNASGATGLWQILGSVLPGDLTNPVVNARNAVAKWRDGGLAPWTASRDVWGPLVSGGGGGGGGGILGAISGALSDVISGGADAIIGKLPGTGGLPDWLKGLGTYTLDHVTGWIKDKVTGMFESVFGGGDVKPITGAGEAGIRLAAGIAQASSMDAARMPYVYGGGHGSFAGPWDCSGAVSAVLHAMGVLGSPVTTDGLKGYGAAGDGELVTIGVRGSTGRNAHTMLKLGNRYFESGSGHGAQWVSGWSGGFPIHRHPPGMARGGMWADPRRFAGPGSPDFPGWGLRQGGMLPYAGSFAQGGTVPGPKGAPSVAVVHGGEKIIAAAKGIKFGTSFLTSYKAAEYSKASAQLALAEAQGNTRAQKRALTTIAGIIYERIQYASRILGEHAAVNPNAMTQALAGLINSLHETEARIAEINAPPAAEPLDTPDAGTASTDDLSASVDALNETIRLLNDQIEMQRQETLKAQQAYNVSQSNYAVLAKAIADISNGQIGGRVGLGFMTPGFAGGGVRY